MAGVNMFQQWLREGVTVSLTRTVIVTMDRNHTVEAVYAPARTLTLVSSNPAAGVLIALTCDSYGPSSCNGNTPFTRTYVDGRTVNVAGVDQYDPATGN